MIPSMSPGPQFEQELPVGRLPRSFKTSGQYDRPVEHRMLATKTVLLCGHNPDVSETRRLLLTGAGYQVSVTGSSDEALQLFVSSPIDILVICHTVPRDSAQNLFLIARALQPAVKILFLTTETPSPHQRLGDEVHDILDGPAKLLQKVTSMASISVQTR